VLIERRPEALQEAHCTYARIGRRRGATTQFALDAANEDAQYPRRQRRIAAQRGPQPLGQGHTHCRIGTRGITESTTCAAVAAMRFVVQDGQTPRPLQEKATRNSAVQSGQRARAKPCARNE
jgi:hypothetical protein